MASKAKKKSSAKTAAKKSAATKQKKSGILSAKLPASQSAAPAGPTLQKDTLLDQHAVCLYLLMAFFIPFIMMFFAFKAMGVSPFGTNQILATDQWHQYYPFLVDYQDKLQNGGSLLWTWKSGGGTNYVALMSYYLASPLNFFTVMIPAEKLRAFLCLPTCIKLGLASFFYPLFLRLTFKRKDASLTAFGIMYALCAFIMGYYWNNIWLDTIALLPLVIAGTIALLRDGKYKLYILSLALSILANYYIGLFTCVFVFFVSLGYCIVEYKGWRNLISRFLKMAGCTIVSLMMTAILTLPTYFALQYTHSSDNTFPKKFAINIGSTPNLAGVLEGIGKTIGNSVAFTEPTTREGLPNIYCGVFVIFLALLFFFCSKIKLRERIFCGLLQLFFILSFIIRQLDYVWHGFHFPNMLPHRFSFLYSFVLIYMAFRVFMYIDELKLASVLAGIFSFIIYMGIAYTYVKAENSAIKLSGVYEKVVTKEPLNPVLLSAYFGGLLAAWILLYVLRDRIPRFVMAIGACAIGIAAIIIIKDNKDIVNAAVNQSPESNLEFHKFLIAVAIVITVGAILLIIFKSINVDHQMTKVLLSLVLLILAITEGLLSVAAGVKVVGVTGTEWYPLGGQDTLNCVNKAKELEENTIDLPRTEVNKYYSLNDNALIGADGISMFNSMTNRDVTAYMEKFGICGWIESNRYTYQESSPFTNLMLNVKYIVTPLGAYIDTTDNKLLYQSGNVKLLENQHYLPQGFMVNKELLNFDVENAQTNPMENQNDLFRMATGMTGNLYEYLESSSVDAASQSGTITANGVSTFTYSSNNGNDSYDINYVANRDGVATAYLSAPAENISIRVNGSERIGYYIKRPFIMMIGNVKKDDPITLHVTAKNSSNGNSTAYCAMFNESLFQRGYNQLSRCTMKADTVTDDHISGKITAEKDGLFYTSIAYSSGWKAYVDGEEVEITPVGDALVAFPLSAGTHEIELKYMPEGLIPGIIITILALLIFLAMIFLIPRREKVLAKAKSVLKIGASPTDNNAANNDNKTMIADDGNKTISADDEKTIIADDDDNKTISADDEKTISADDDEKTVIADA